MRSKIHYSVKYGLISLIFSALLSSCASTSKSNEKKADLPFSIDLKSGVSYNDNVSVTEIDAISGQSDTIGYITGRVKFDKDIGENTAIDASYRFTRNAHSEFSNFDTQTHLISVGVEQDFGDVEVGVSYQYADSELDSDGFLALSQISPYVEKYVSKTVLLRGTYRFSEKKFDGRPERDSTGHRGAASVYYFLDGVRQYIQTGYSYEDVDTLAPEFVHGEHNFRIRYIRRIPFNDRNAKVEAGWRYEQRDYSNITPSIAAVRNDKRHRFEAEVEIPITENVYGLIELEHAIKSSNLPSADFNRKSATASVGVRF